MTDPARAQTVDTDIAKHCAYSLPGVALTLGRQNWHCLKDTYETLASDVQVKEGFSVAHANGGGGHLIRRHREAVARLVDLSSCACELAYLLVSDELKLSVTNTWHHSFCSTNSPRTLGTLSCTCLL
jgi:hypothetical protein